MTFNVLQLFKVIFCPQWCSVYVAVPVRDPCLMLQYHIRQGLNALGLDLAFLVVDLLRLFVAEQEYNCTKQEDGGAPADAVRPPELPHLSVACKIKHHTLYNIFWKLTLFLLITHFTVQIKFICVSLLSTSDM